jgi:hypothetical protein
MPAASATTRSPAARTLGASKRMICQRSTWPGRPRLRAQNGGGSMPSIQGEGGTFYGLKCNYRLVIDNLMDLTHETYVHAGSIGDDARHRPRPRSAPRSG